MNLKLDMATYKKALLLAQLTNSTPERVITEAIDAKVTLFLAEYERRNVRR